MRDALDHVYAHFYAGNSATGEPLMDAELAEELLQVAATQDECVYDTTADASLRRSPERLGASVAHALLSIYYGEAAQAGTPEYDARLARMYAVLADRAAGGMGANL